MSCLEAAHYSLCTLFFHNSLAISDYAPHIPHQNVIVGYNTTPELDISYYDNHTTALRPCGKLMPSVSHRNALIRTCILHLLFNQYPIQVFELSESDGSIRQTVLGSDLLAGHSFQHVVRPGVWFGAYPALDYDLQGNAAEQSASGRKGYSLVGCTVAPAFEFADFELAKREDLLKLFPTAEKFITLLT